MSKSKIQDYLLSHPINRTETNPYDKAAQALNVDKEIVRSAWRCLRKAGLVEKEGSANYVHVEGLPPYNAKGLIYTTNSTADGFTINIKGDDATIKKQANKEVKNELDLAEECDIDLSEWKITEWECKRYEAWIKNKQGEIESQPKFSVYAKMKRRSLDTDLGLQKQAILEEIKAYAPDYKETPFHYTRGKEHLLLISLFDVHFGRLAHADESGEDYDIKIAEARFKTAVKELLSRVDLDLIERIAFPLGNDLINVDNLQSSTTAGTLQASDSRFHKIIKTVKRVLVETIDMLSTIAPVDVISVPGNHDTQTAFLLAEILEAWYHNSDIVKINNSAKLRKYYQYGKNGFLLTHGDKEKHADLGLIFASEEPKIWATSKFRFCQVGHFHKSKKISYISNDEYQGFQVQVLPSLASSCAWTYGKGYGSNKAAKAFLYHKTDGPIAEFTFTV